MNQANGGNLFRQVDKNRDAEQELQQEFLLNDAISMVREKSIEELLPVAIFFGFNVNAPTSEIRFNLLNIAKKKPAEFIQSFDNPQVQARSIVKQAADYQFINLKPDGAYWFDSNTLIVSVPAGQDPLDVLTRFCLTEKGSAVFSNLEEKLSKLG
jgi:type II secretory pathway pseudopilin PulG